MKALQTLTRHLDLYAYYAKCMMQAKFQDRLNALLVPFAVFVREAGTVCVIYLTVRRFGHIGGWGKDELLFLFSILFLSYAMLIFFFAGFRDFSDQVHTGKLDQLLVRPHSVLFQVLLTRFDLPAVLGHGSLGVCLFLYTAKTVGITWTASHIFYCLFMLISGVMIQGALFMLFACSAFWITHTSSLMEFLFFNVRKFAAYPISIYPLFIQKFLIFVVPFAFVNYFPAQFFLQKKSEPLYWNGMYFIAPLIGIGLLWLAQSLWKVGLRNYTSSGS